METYCSYDEMIDLSELKPHPRNPNTHPPQQITALAKIMTENGVRMPIVVSNRSGYITKGHGRRLAALEAGFTEYPVDHQEYESDEAELADMLADNVIAEFSIIDQSLKMSILDDLEISGVDLELTGVIEFSGIDLSETDGSEQGRLDELVPKMCECPNCKQVFDYNEHKLNG